ncbi:MAG: response regulator transcription factor [Pyrinomonadaceae bacterium]|nr:response regulator transcription factor [Pyrinomonadaceae bacterium]
MIRALIVDDEPLARERIRTLLESESDIEVVAECGDGLSAVSTIERERPDLLFLDVQMPEMDGFRVLEACGAQAIASPAIIFVTAYDKYALRAFDVHALDYLLKPFDRERFARAIERARAVLMQEKKGAIDERLLALLADIKQETKHLERLVVKASGRVFFLKTEEIDWIESASNYVRLHTGRESHLMRETMSALEAKLDPKKFLRVNRSAIVQIEKIKELHPLFRGEYEIVLHDGTRLTLGRAYREKLQELLGHAF